MKDLQDLIAIANRQKIAPFVLKNADFVNVFTGQLDHGDIAIANGKIAGIGTYSGEKELDCQGKVLLPGLIDSHIHLESSLVMPEEFAKCVVQHGTTTVVSDPHEIANIMGTKGIDFMLQATESLPIDVMFMLPSCVPATSQDEGGATLEAMHLAPYYNHPRVLGLAEVMDFVAVLSGDTSVLAKIQDALHHRLAIDGHAPMLSASALQGYIVAGIGSDHECAYLEEAMEKLRFGMMIMIREGTAAHNLETLAPIITPRTASRCLFCTDDKHPSQLLKEGHIDMILRKAVSLGVDPILAVTVATRNPAEYFNLKQTGAIATGYYADITVVDNLRDFQVQSVYKKGKLVFQEDKALSYPPPLISPHLIQSASSTMQITPKTAEDFRRPHPCAVIGLVAGEILTTNEGMADAISVEKDILKIAVLERHKHTGHIGVGYLSGYGLRQGAIATSIAHDSHNIIVVGTKEEEMAAAVNALIQQQGGIVVTKDGEVSASLPLEIGGIMSRDTLPMVNVLLEKAKNVAYLQGVSTRIDPFMTLSFLSLTVIPTLRINTHGVFDVQSQCYLSQ